MHQRSATEAFAEQWRRLRQDLDRQVFGKRVRWLTIFLNPSTWVHVNYRFERAMYLATGRWWRVLRVAVLPIQALMYPWIGNCDISYMSDLGGGLAILHPALGVVIGRYVVVGEDCVFTGGNCLGWKERREGPFRLGARVRLGPNATVLGPVVLGDDVDVGAGAVVVHDFDGPGTLLGVPATPSTAGAA